MPLLLKADDPRHWEVPPNFPYLEELERIEALKPLLEEEIGSGLTLEVDSIQDAAYWAELHWLTEPRGDLEGSKGNMIFTHIGIRFSGFGRLVAIWSNVPEEPPLSQSLIINLSGILEEYKFEVISNQDLFESYTGNNRHNENIDSWWSRYFDYCSA